MVGRRFSDAGLVLVGAILALALALGCGPARAVAAGAPVTVNNQGSGTFTVDQTYQYSGGSCSTHDVWTLHWTSSFDTTLDGGVLAGAQGSLTSGSPGSANLGVSGICTYNNTVPPCQTTLGTPAGSPSLSVSGTSPERIEAQSLVAGVMPGGCAATDGPFIGRDAYVFNAALPDAVTAIADVPAEQLAPGFSTPVDVSKAPGQASGTCTGQGPAASTNTACSWSFTWDGTLSIGCKGGASVGKVSLSDGDAPAVGTVVCDGQTLRTGAKSHLEVTLNDGSIIRLGPDSEATLDSQSEFMNSDQEVSVKLILGTIWAKLVTAAGGNDQFEVVTDRAVAGVRGCEVTAAVDPSTGALSYHVIQGTGFVRIPGKPERDFPPGYTATLKGTQVSLDTVWPAAQQALVPAGLFPPKLTGLRLSGHNLGARARLAYRLDSPAAVTVTVLKGTRTVARFHAQGHAGLNQLVLRHAKLRSGRYDVLVSATHQQLTSLGYLDLAVH